MDITAKLATKVLQTAVSGQEAGLKPLETGGSGSFQQILGEMKAGGEMADMLGMGDASLGGGKIQSIPAAGFEFKPDASNVGLEKPKGAEKIVDMLSEVNKGQMQMDNLVNEILYSGKKFSNQELLAIQAHVFHFAQMTELTVKVAEHGVGSVKTVLNTQVQ